MYAIEMSEVEHNTYSMTSSRVMVHFK